jgi:hypothetical protein
LASEIRLWKFGIRNEIVTKYLLFNILSVRLTQPVLWLIEKQDAFQEGGRNPERHGKLSWQEGEVLN